MSNVTEADSPTAIVPVSKSPAAVAVCGALSSLVQVTVSPTSIETEPGPKAKPAMDTALSAARTGVAATASTPTSAPPSAARRQPRPDGRCDIEPMSTLLRWTSSGADTPAPGGRFRRCILTVP